VFIVEGLLGAAVIDDASQFNTNQHYKSDLQGAIGVGISERGKEIKRRQSRRKKLVLLKQRVAKAGSAEKEAIAQKIRNMTPGAEGLIASWGLEER